MNNNYELMQRFLDIIKEFAISNPDKDITENFVYSQLMLFNIRRDQNPYQDISYNNKSWINRYNNNPNIDVFKVESRKCFLWFTNGNISGNEIKLYVPLDSNHILKGANQLFDFISTTGISHQSKIANVVRNDNIVIRVNDLNSAQTIINFVKNNHYIQEGLVKVNPFLPSINGVGITMDNTYSFNSTLSSIISDFIMYLKHQNKLNLLTLENLNIYIKNRMNSITDLDLKDIYELLYKTTTKNFKLQDFVNHANYKLIDKYTSDRKRIVDEKFYFEQAIIITNRIYPQNTKTAILEYLKGNPNYFTNKENARNGLIKYVHPGIVISLMRTKLSENNVQIPFNDNELVENYLSILLNKNINKNNENDNLTEMFNIIKTAYINTFNIYGYEQARVAIKSLLINGDKKYFTNRFKDREKLNAKLKDADIKKIVLSNIDINNLDVNNVDEIVNRFIYLINSGEFANNMKK